jgi:hypothetical protein
VSTTPGAFSFSESSPPPTLFPQADKASILSEDDVKATVANLVVDDGPLKNALAAKVNIADAFTREDTIAVVDDLINGAAGEGEDTLRDVLDSFTARLESLEEITQESCGRHCRAGEFVKSPCSESSSTVCADCPSEHFSLGGLPNACTECKTYVVWHGELFLEKQSVKIKACEKRCKCKSTTSPSLPPPFLLFIINTPRSCKPDEFQAASCTSSTDRSCQTCEICPAGQFEQTACGALTDTVCKVCGFSSLLAPLVPALLRP